MKKPPPFPIINELTIESFTSRQCTDPVHGACRACCYGMQITNVPLPANPALKITKPIFTHCPQECTAGCRLHGDLPDQPAKPYDCTGYYCMWRASMIKEPNEADPCSRRPDKLGVIFDVSLTHTGTSIAAREVWANARLRPQVNKVIRGIATNVLIVLRLHPTSNDRMGRKSDHPQFQKFQVYAPKRMLSRLDLIIEEDGAVVRSGKDSRSGSEFIDPKTVIGV